MVSGVTTVLTAAAYDIHLEQLLDRLKQLHEILSSAGIPYRIVGGMGVFLHVFSRDPLKARLTRDVDAAIGRDSLSKVIEAARGAGLAYRHVAGADMLIDDKPGARARSAVHLIFTGEKVRPDYLEPSAPEETGEGILIAPVADLVRMKLTAYRLEDRAHIQDLDGVGLITPEIEASLSEPLRQRLAEVRATE